MFLKNKYTLWYFNIINSANSQGRQKGKSYYEKHHIIPKCLGGKNSKNNLILLTAREHFICHWLLCKMTNENKSKLYFSFYRMSHSSNNQLRNYSSYEYNIAKKYNSLASKNRIFTPETKIKMSETHKKIWNESSDRKIKMAKAMSIYNKQPKKEITKIKISKTLTGVKHTEERNNKKSQKQKKTFKLIKNNGEIIITSDLKSWCKENNHTYSCIFNVMAKRIKYHKSIIDVSLYILQ